MFQPPDRDPPSRSVKHYICVPPDVVPAARRAYPLPYHKLTAMREQMHELIEKGWFRHLHLHGRHRCCLFLKMTGKSNECALIFVISMY